MASEFFIEQPMQMIELKLKMIIGENPLLIYAHDHFLIKK